LVSVCVHLWTGFPYSSLTLFSPALYILVKPPIGERATGYWLWLGLQGCGRYRLLLTVLGATGWAAGCVGAVGYALGYMAGLRTRVYGWAAGVWALLGNKGVGMQH